MREIKFRAWHEGRKAWVHDRDPGCNILGEVILFGGWMDGVSIEELNDIVVEQFTGLKDKEGREIYEGDVVRVSHGGRHYWLYEMKCFGGQFGNNIYGECFEHNLSTDDSERMYTFEKVRGSFFRSECLGGKWSEVIGNIHENADLIK